MLVIDTDYKTEKYSFKGEKASIQNTRKTQPELQMNKNRVTEGQKPKHIQRYRGKKSVIKGFKYVIRGKLFGV